MGLTFEEAILNELAAGDVPAEERQNVHQSNVILISNLNPEATDADLKTLFHHSRAQIVSAEVVRDQTSEFNAGYAHVVMDTPDAALNAVNLLGGEGTKVVVGSGYGTLGFSKTVVPSDLDKYNLYIGDLPLGITETEVSEYLEKLWKIILGDKNLESKDAEAKISSMGPFEMKLPHQSKTTCDFCFVKFEIPNVAKQLVRLADHLREESESLPPIKYGKVPFIRRMKSRPPVTLEGEQPLSKEEEPHWSNTTLCVMSLPEDISEKDLRRFFGKFGEIVSIRIAIMKHLAFVRFANNVSALAAMIQLEGEPLKGKAVRLFWARSRDPVSADPDVIDEVAKADKEKVAAKTWQAALEPDTDDDEMQDLRRKRRRLDEAEKSEWAQQLVAQLDNSAVKMSTYLCNAPPPPPFSFGPKN